MSAIAHSQNRNGLVCGLSTRKIFTPWPIQNSMTRFSSRPQRLPVVGLEVDRIDVLVLLGRVLRVLDRAVRPLAEPLGMLLDVRDDRATPGRRGRARSRAPAARAASTNRSKSSIVPRPGSTASCPPASPPIAHGLPDRPGPASSVLFRPLRKARPIGWIGGRYRTSKPIDGDVRQPRLGVVERAARVGIGPDRAREHLVPGAEPRPLPFDRHLQLAGVACRPATDRARRAIAVWTATASAAATRSGWSIVSSRQRRRRFLAQHAPCSSSAASGARRSVSLTSAAPSSSSLFRSCPAPNFFDTS